MDFLKVSAENVKGKSDWQKFGLQKFAFSADKGECVKEFVKRLR